MHNVGISTCLNFRIQNHNLLLAETEGYYTMQQNYTSLDIHVGQSYSFLVTMDQNASSDYYIVASARFVNQSTWQKVTGVAILHYSNSKGKAAGPLPDPPNDFYDTSYVVNQAMSIRFVPLILFIFYYVLCFFYWEPFNCFIIFSPLCCCSLTLNITLSDSDIHHISISSKETFLPLVFLDFL